MKSRQPRTVVFPEGWQDGLSFPEVPSAYGVRPELWGGESCSRKLAGTVRSVGHLHEERLQLQILGGRVWAALSRLKVAILDKVAPSSG